MKYSTFFSAAALLAVGAEASHRHQLRHAHPKFPRAVNATNEECPVTCEVSVTSYLVDVERQVPTAAPSTVKVTATVVPVEPTSTSTSTQLTTVTVPKANLPTPEVTTAPTPGTYTIPAKTVIVTSTTAVCVATETTVPAGTHTLGGVTTIVKEATTVVCPVATIETSGTVTTSRIYTTTYVCPTAGTYTIGPVTTVAPVETVVKVPVVTVFQPGTYTHPQIVTTITQTNYVVTCPLETVKVTATVVPVAAQTPVAVPVAAPAASSPAAKAAPVASTPAKIPSHDGAYAITYSPFNNDRSCRTPANIKSDIKQIADKHFKAIRIYAPDCSYEVIQAIGEACEIYKLQIVLGVFIDDTKFVNANKQLETLIKWNKWHLVDLFVVGNEAVFGLKCTGTELASYIAEVKVKVRAAGYNGPVTTAETLNIFESEYKHLCSVIDAVGLNIHPFFNPSVTADKAGDFVVSQLKIAIDLCGGNKPGFVLEAGWPNSGEANGAAIPGKSEQAVAIASIKEKSKNTVFFTWTNDGWKPPGAFGVEPNFGCGDLF